MEPQKAIAYILNRLEKELPEHLYYHGHHHTLQVLESVKRIAATENVSGMPLDLLLVATAFHDSGFLIEYQDHEQHGCDIARKELPQFGFGEEAIGKICDMIMATRIPQNPCCNMAEMLCDADLDYLGTDRFRPIGDSLYKELRSMDKVSDRKTWDEIQLNFLSSHTYYTRFSIENRQPIKEKHIQELKQELGIGS